MKFLSSSQFVLFICILTKKIQCDSVPDSCGPGRFYSEHIPGCVKCSDIAKCGDQDYRDVQRCTEACVKKTKCDSVPKSVADCGLRRFYSVHIPGCTGCPDITKCGDHDTCDVDRCNEACVPKNDQSTLHVTTLINTTSLEVRSTRRTTPKTLQSKHSGTKHSTNVGLAVSIGVLGTFVVCLVALAAYVMWRCKSGTSRDVQVEEGGEPSTSSQESIPDVTKRLQSCPARSLEKTEEGIRLPVPETEKLICNAKGSNVSSINLEECEN